ncbi:MULTISPECIES: phosphoethanolamine transferase [unclassified Moraxella]|uniref:phosphoethanolamine transferase n=1 Tax=unclassified Moraxella TaxID=2685852 RepID=UPI003AF44C59
MLKKIQQLRGAFSLTQTQLTVLVIGYLWLLNNVANHHLSATLQVGWVAFALVALSLMLGMWHRYLLKAILSLHLIVTSIALFAKINYQTTLTEDIMLSALISEADLTVEMISPKFVLWVMLTAGLPMMLVWWVNIRQQAWLKQLLSDTLTIVVALMIGVLWIKAKGYDFRVKGQIRDARFVQDITKFSPVDAEYSLHRAWRAKKSMQAMYANVELMTQTHQYQATNDDLLVVFVIGESTRGNHFALNGYPRATTPKLAKIQGLYSLKNATSCDTLTINSVHCLASPMLKTQADRKVHQSSFGQVFHEMGYHTELYSLQTLTGFYDYLYPDKLVTKYTVLNEQPTGAKDKSLLPYAKQAIQSYDSGKQLLIFHTLGVHQTYADRFDPSDVGFEPYCQDANVAKCDTASLINAYDNGILAVDNFLAQMIEMLKDKKAVFIYVSDHGESLGENGQYFHGQPVATAPKEQFDIAFLAWFSEPYKATPQGKVLSENFARHLSRGTAVSHDNIFHSLLGCAGIRSPNGGIDSKLNLCEDF